MDKEIDTFTYKKRQMIIAIDFDGTIVENKWPHIGTLKQGAKEVINNLYDNFNIDIIIWTCRGDKELEKALNFLKEMGIHYTCANRNVSMIERYYSFEKEQSPKIFADFYIDDKCILSRMYPDKFNWYDIENYILEFKYRHQDKFL